ncbi:hypothetical protein HN789_02995 [archaeon]|jgi:hypothetical protein|nr:hypothetical protein [archaeon]MBT4023229.1 hypothetical protein [archaeon]MBT4271899.1 hypothetical protein [archaeon]MBT4460998.1 hypothetical protein [archaeon]MBT4858426.1 hypothetical protein [archaeon]
MAKKKLSWVDDVLNFFNVIVDKIVEHSDAKIEEIKRKTVHYVVIYGIFTVSLLFILLGLIKYLAEIFVFASEGIAFMVVGSIMIVILAAYTMFSKI